MLAGTIKANGNITVVIDDNPYSVSVDHPYYHYLVDAWRDDDPDSFLDYFYQKINPTMQKAAALIEDIGTGITVTSDSIHLDGRKIPDNVAKHFIKRLVGLKENNLPVQPVLNFLARLMDNPSSRSIEEAPDFLENKNMPITSDGCFLAYKTVKSNWYSKASGSLTLVTGEADESGYIRNMVGDVIECKRNEVDDERSNECSHGLHVGGLEYAGPGGWYNSAGDKVVIVKVDPRDIVSVPKDHNAQKLRVCKYEVVKEYEAPMRDTYSKVKEAGYVLVEPKLYHAVTFEYPDRHSYGELEQRYLFVESMDERHISGRLLREDPSFVNGGEYRKFLKEDISNLKLYNPLEEVDDYDDEDDEDDLDQYDYYLDTY